MPRSWHRQPKARRERAATTAAVAGACADATLELEHDDLPPQQPRSGWRRLLGRLAVLGAVLAKFKGVLLPLPKLKMLQRWEARRSGADADAAYCRVEPRHRLAVGATSVCSIFVLGVGMDLLHIARELP